MAIDYSQPIAEARDMVERIGDLFPMHRERLADALTRYAEEAGPEHPQHAELTLWAERLAER